MNILVLCTGNSARSILLESILNTQSAGRIRAFSAGSAPTGTVHPQSLKTLTHHTHPINTARSKSWDEFATDSAPQMDVVITVCGSAASETCPIWPGSPITSHWGVEDPAAAGPDEWDRAFATTYALLLNRAQSLIALPFETLDKAALKIALDKIGTL